MRWRLIVVWFAPFRRPGVMWCWRIPVWTYFIGPRRDIEFETDEVVEVVAGMAQCRYPVDRIISFSWRYANLGALRGAGKTITSAEPGYSLLAITYASRAYAWDVSHLAIEDVQFLLMEQ
jgi:hypothetical protein